MLRRLVADLVAAFTSGRRGGSLVGRAEVVDGDTILVAGERVRLHGIDAPELDQTFWRHGEQIVCGTMASAALEALTAGVKLRCEVVERDRHGRLVAKVFSPNGVDIGRRLVSSGWAVAYRHYSTDYVAAENEARKAKRGMWKGTFVAPWEWRASPQVRWELQTAHAPRRSPPADARWAYSRGYRKGRGRETAMVWIALIAAVFMIAVLSQDDFPARVTQVLQRLEICA